MNKKSENNMIIAFILNLIFTIIEIIGGIFTNSISIISDAVHDLGDSISIGIAIILEKISKKKPDKMYTYGYLRFSIIGAIINLLILSIGTTIVLYNAIPRLINPEVVNYEGMFWLAIAGIVINLIGTLRTNKGTNISEKVISLHLLEDMLGWIAVLIVSLVIKEYKVYILDPILSIGISIIILINIVKNIKKVLDIILEKVPKGIKIDDIKRKIEENKDVKEIHHIHVWTLDGNNNYLTAHICLNKNLDLENVEKIIENIKHEISHFNIHHSTLEVEKNLCEEKECEVKIDLNNITSCHSHDYGHDHKH